MALLSKPFPVGVRILFSKSPDMILVYNEVVRRWTPNKESKAACSTMLVFI